MEGFQLHYCSMESSLYAKKGKKEKRKGRNAFDISRQNLTTTASATKMDKNALLFLWDPVAIQLLVIIKDVLTTP